MPFPIDKQIEEISLQCLKRRAIEMQKYEEWLRVVSIGDHDDPWPRDEAYAYLQWIEASENHDRWSDILRNLQRDQARGETRRIPLTLPLFD